MKHKFTKESIIEFILIVGIFCFLGAIFVTNIFHFTYKMNADIASDVILSRLMWDSKSIVPSSWYTAMELRLICTPNLSSLLYALTGNLNLSMGLACFFMTIMILISAGYLMKVLEMPRKYSLLMLFCLLMLSNNFIILELFYLFASYYAIHIVITFLTIGIYADCLKKRKAMWLGMTISVFFAFVLGAQGVRGILVIYGPLFGMEFLRNIYCIYLNKKRKKEDIFLGIWVTSLLVISFAGTMLPFSVGQEVSRNIRNGLKKLMTIVIPDAGRTIGFANVSIIGKVILGLLLIISIVEGSKILLRMWKKEKIDLQEWIYLVLYSSPVVSALMVAFTTTESSERYYYMLLIAIPYGVILICQKLNSKGETAIIGLVFLLAAIHFTTVYVPLLKAPLYSESAESKVTDFLKAEGYQTAYATFENANTMTVLANGEIRIAAVATVEKMDICKWMTSTDWYVPNVPYEETTVYIITEAELEYFEPFRKQHEEELRYLTQIGKYHIFESDYNYSNLGE